MLIFNFSGTCDPGSTSNRPSVQKAKANLDTSTDTCWSTGMQIETDNVSFNQNLKHTLTRSGALIRPGLRLFV